MGWIPKHLKSRHKKRCDKCSGKLMLQYDGYGQLYILCTTAGCVCEKYDPNSKSFFFTYLWPLVEATT